MKSAGCKAVRCMERPHALAILCNSIEANTKWTLKAPKDESHVAWHRVFSSPVRRRSDLRQAPSMISMSLHLYQFLHEKLYDPMSTVWIRYIVRPSMTISSRSLVTSKTQFLRFLKRSSLKTHVVLVSLGRKSHGEIAKMADKKSQDMPEHVRTNCPCAWVIGSDMIAGHHSFPIFHGERCIFMYRYVQYIPFYQHFHG